MNDLKQQIFVYKDENDLSYRELAEELGLSNHQGLYQWLHKPEKIDPFAVMLSTRFAKLTRG